MLKDDTDKGYWEDYLDHIGLFFIFTACAGISIIVCATWGLPFLLVVDFQLKNIVLFNDYPKYNPAIILSVRLSLLFSDSLIIRNMSNYSCFPCPDKNCLQSAWTGAYSLWMLKKIFCQHMGSRKIILLSEWQSGKHHYKKINC